MPVGLVVGRSGTLVLFSGNFPCKHPKPVPGANLDHPIQARSPILKFLRGKPMQQRMGKFRV